MLIQLLMSHINAFIDSNWVHIFVISVSVITIYITYTFITTTIQTYRLRSKTSPYPNEDTSNFYT